MDDTEMIGGQAPSKHNAIAPPVAAGIVDTILTPEFGVLMWMHVRTPLDQAGFADVVSHINAWGAQQREVGYHEGVEQLRHERDSLLVLVTESQDRAQKSEADLKQVNEWRAAALAESQMLGELWAAKVEKAEAEAARAWKSRNEMISNFNLNNELFGKEVDTLKVIQQSIYKELKEKNSVLSKLETLLRSEIDHATFNNHRLPAGMALEGEYAVRASCIEACIEGAKRIEV